jgi:MOSC domain-containing protein YiiM
MTLACDEEEDMAMVGDDIHSMRIVSVNVGKPREVLWHGRPVLTSIYKYPVEGSVRLERYNFAGDQQSDLTVHGGPGKAVYVYAESAYAYWHQELPDVELPWGSFGENLTMAGVSDDTVYIGDRYQIGTAELIVTQPRIPCFKLGIRFGRDTFVKQFLRAGRPGFYLAIVREGEIAAGDAVTLLARGPEGVTVNDIVRLYAQDRADEAGIRRAISAKALPESWREWFEDRLDQIAARKPAL